MPTLRCYYQYQSKYTVISEYCNPKSDYWICFKWCVCSFPLYFHIHNRNGNKVSITRFTLSFIENDPLHIEAHWHLLVFIAYWTNHTISNNIAIILCSGSAIAQVVGYFCMMLSTLVWSIGGI